MVKYYQKKILQSPSFAKMRISASYLHACKSMCLLKSEWCLPKTLVLLDSVTVMMIGREAAESLFHFPKRRSLQNTANYHNVWTIFQLVICDDTGYVTVK